MGPDPHSSVDLVNGDGGALCGGLGLRAGGPERAWVCGPRWTTPTMAEEQRCVRRGLAGIFVGRRGGSPRAMGCRCLGLGWYDESSHGISLAGASSERQREVAESGGGASVQRKWRGRGFQRGLAGACGMCVWKLLGRSGLDGGERRVPRAAARGAPERGGEERKRGTVEEVCENNEGVLTVGSGKGERR